MAASVKSSHHALATHDGEYTQRTRHACSLCANARRRVHVPWINMPASPRSDVVVLTSCCRPVMTRAFELVVATAVLRTYNSVITPPLLSACGRMFCIYGEVQRRGVTGERAHMVSTVSAA